MLKRVGLALRAAALVVLVWVGMDQLKELIGFEVTPKDHILVFLAAWAGAIMVQ